MQQDDELVMTIAETIAEREGVDVTALETPLHDAIDTEALESLLTTSPAGAGISVTFSYYGYSIRVDGDGGIRVSETSPDTTPTAASV